MPLMPLETFRKILGYNPWHFFSLVGTVGRTKVDSACNDVVYEYPWQNANAAGRQGVLDALQTAEDKLFDYLLYRPGPRYVTETIAYPRFYDTMLRAGYFDPTGHWASVETREKYLLAIGVETRAAIQTGVAVTYSDPDGDTINEVATFSVATTVTDPDQIEVYFTSADRFDGSSIPATGDAGDAARFQIRPLTVRISGGTATIRGPSWLFVKPALQETGVNLDPATAGNFAATVDIYRRYTDPDGTTSDTAQAALIWESQPCGGFWWCCDSTDPAATAQAVARAAIRDSRRGLVSLGPAAYDSVAATWSAAWCGTPGYAPDRVTLRYRAGIALVDGQIARQWQPIVARLAMAELSEELCGCETANRELHRWRFDLARSGGANDEQYGAISAADLDNPYGTRRGQVAAWRAVKNLRVTPGVAPG
jgi:hypothetical protein